MKKLLGMILMFAAVSTSYAQSNYYLDIKNPVVFSQIGEKSKAVAAAYKVYSSSYGDKWNVTVYNYKDANISSVELIEVRIKNNDCNDYNGYSSTDTDKKAICELIVAYTSNQ